MYLYGKFVAVFVLLACAAASCVTEEEITTEAVAQASVLENLSFCSVDGRPPTRGCVATAIDTRPKRVTMSLDESQLVVPRDLRSVEWTIKSEDGGVEVVSGCFFGLEACVFDVQPTCTRELSFKSILVKVSVRNVRTGFTQVGIGTSILISNSNDIFSPSCLLQRFIGCVTRPATAPRLGIFSQSCGGLHTMVAHPVEGQTHTQFQTKPRVPFVSWDNVSDSFSFPGITADVSSGSCSGDANGDFLARARACNECGCGPWSSEARFTYFNGECR